MAVDDALRLSYVEILADEQRRPAPGANSDAKKNLGSSVKVPRAEAGAARRLPPMTCAAPSGELVG